MTRLILFDIDGTLIQSGRAGLRGLNAAFARLYGKERVLDALPFAGRTDRAIVSDALRSIGRDPALEEIARLRDAYLGDLQTEMGRPVDSPCGVLPGVAAILQALDQQPATQVGLLTGNFERGAAIKLGHFDLWARFPFGAFGDHHEDRRDLLPVALERALALGRPPVAATDTVVIGDTPLDVACARAHGARALAVATGPFSRDELASTGADLVVDSLDDTGAMMAWLASASTS